MAKPEVQIERLKRKIAKRDARIAGLEAKVRKLEMQATAAMQDRDASQAVRRALETMTLVPTKWQSATVASEYRFRFVPRMPTALGHAQVSINPTPITEKKDD